jgi:hypothetical protein
MNIRLDGQIQYEGVTPGGGDKVDRGASAKANLRAVVDTAKTMRFDKTYQGLKTYSEAGAQRMMQDWTRARLDEFLYSNASEVLTPAEYNAELARLTDDFNDAHNLEVAPWVTALKGVGMTAVGLVRDAAEIAIGPVAIVKDVADAAFHGILKLFGK